MSDDIDVHKVSEKHERRAEHIKDKLEKQGMGQDHAEEEAMRQAMDEIGPSTGGGNSAGDPSKHANQQDNHRRGSEH
jgi:hypothetical protein